MGDVKFHCKSPRIKLLPVPKGTTLRVQHFHVGNTDWIQGPRGEPIQYETDATLLNEYGEIVAEGRAFCSPKDVPNRKLGYAIARNRAIKNYYRVIL